MTADLLFPAGFQWGASSSAYQIEGAVREGGREESIWDVFCQRPGTIADGSSGEFACDGYHRTRDDIAIMKDLGLTSYRFSIAWPRIIPTGRGAVNQAGIDHYKHFVNDLLEAGIRPMVTLYHWDLPRPLQSHGGWASRDTAARFGEYAHVVARALAPEVTDWSTINEPSIASFLGCYLGIHAPGIRDLKTTLATAHHLLLGHAEGMEALRAEMRPGSRAGIVLVVQPVEPATDSQADLEAAHRTDGFMNRWFLDPLYRGTYPDDMVEIFGDAMPEIANSDFARISQPTDFLGLNYYSPMVMRWDPSMAPLHGMMAQRPGAPTNHLGWTIDPNGLHQVLMRLHSEYQVGEMVIAENGGCFQDHPRERLDGTLEIDDRDRERYLLEHLVACHRAIADGVHLTGYFVWSFLDVFEWNNGYTSPFGIVHVDRDTQARTIKRSGTWYAQVTRDHGVSS